MDSSSNDMNNDFYDSMVKAVLKQFVWPLDSKAAILAFDMIRRGVLQLEESNCISSKSAHRPDLRIGSLLLANEIKPNNPKDIGHSKGVEVGDLFYFRMEMCVVGLHNAPMAGISFLPNGEALSIISSGVYGQDDAMTRGDTLIYTGQGKGTSDQQMEGANLALHRSLLKASAVRVIRGWGSHSTAKMYIYDGLYEVREMWQDHNENGKKLYKYRLVRLPGQIEGYSVWETIEKWKSGEVSRHGIQVQDLSRGLEKLPVPVVNDVDGEAFEIDFTYLLTLGDTITIAETTLGCFCSNECQPNDSSCLCNQRNGGLPPYSSTGIVLNNTYVIHECGDMCACPSSCRNRMSRFGLKFQFEVFRTEDRGWGLRSLDPIRIGSFLFEYAGDVVDDIEDDNEYVFDSTRCYDSEKTKHAHFPIEEYACDDSTRENAETPIIISAQKRGNLARFMNHSCSPNVALKRVLRHSQRGLHLHIIFFAIEHIPPMREIVFNYGSPVKEIAGGVHVEKPTA